MNAVLERLTSEEIARARTRFDLIGADVALKRKGREAVGLCPFHNERTPSFRVYPDHFHCLAPATPVLMADLTRKPLGDLIAGDLLLGFDEFSGGRGFDRRFRASEVLAIEPEDRDCIELELSNGRRLISTEDHLWLMRHGTSRGIWWSKSGDPSTTSIVDLASSHDREDSWLSGYIAGILDGEGSLVMRGDARYYQTLLTITQKPGLVLDTVQEILDFWKIRYSVSVDDRGTAHLQVGGKDSVLRLLSKTRPPRLMRKWDPDKLGGTKRRFGEVEQQVVRRRAIGRQQIIKIATSTKTFIADGLASHNCFGCGAHGTAIDYVMRMRNLDFVEAVHEINGTTPRRARHDAPPAYQPSNSEPNRDKLSDVYAVLDGCSPIHAGTAAHLYLWSRGLVTMERPSRDAVGQLLAHPSLYCHEIRKPLPALIAPITSSAGVTAVQRIWVMPRLETVNGAGPKDNRAPLEVRKKTVGEMLDGTVQLMPASKQILGLAEGVETAIAASLLFRGTTVWATCGASRLGSVAIPDGIEHVRIYGDNGGTGEELAYRAAEIYAGSGYTVDVAFPDSQFSDFNDALLAERVGSVR
jgi:hypothetical protein